jgi:hypothetical protein
MNPDIQQMQRDIEELKAFKEAMLASSSLPIGFENAVRERLRLQDVTSISTSGKSGASEDTIIFESGSDVKIALSQPDTFLQLIINGTTYYLPAWN